MQMSSNDSVHITAPFAMPIKNIKLCERFQQMAIRIYFFIKTDQSSHISIYRYLRALLKQRAFCGHHALVRVLKVDGVIRGPGPLSRAFDF